ncbi:multidrug resistance-associated protein 1-like [Watersipora subatra]|uniref:multidrug resistance-associated protein 1-like n=1 Tax=Watersipora subatra TaxID=2589382 RepID=UPI00355B362C
MGKRTWTRDMPSRREQFKVCAGALVDVYRRYGQYSSGLLWIYWLISMLCSGLRAYIYWKRWLFDEREEARTLAILYSSIFLLVIGAFILSSISDASACILETYKDISPEVTASFSSYMTFYWMQPLMATGHRKKREGSGIEREDLYQLSAPDRVNSYYPQFEKDLHDKIHRHHLRQVDA